MYKYYVKKLDALLLEIFLHRARLSYWIHHSLFALFGIEKERFEYIHEHQLKVGDVKNRNRKLDMHPIPDVTNELRLFAIVRNESLRMPYFFEYYSRLGVDRFFIIDNNSTDDTVKIALSRQNLHVFQIEESYKNHWYWMEYFLEKYAKNCWCLVVDADELIQFPFYERLTFKHLISYFEAKRFSAMRSLLIDLYPDKPVKDAIYHEGDDPLEVCNYFDSTFKKGVYYFFDKKKWKYFVEKVFGGGVRFRLFQPKNGQRYGFCLSKISLFKYSKDIYLVQGMHAINGATFADVQGAVMHTKFLSNLIENAKIESQREEHFNNAMEYKLYHRVFSENPDITFIDERSIRYKDSNQLVDLEMMKSSKQYEKFIAKIK